MRICFLFLFLANLSFSQNQPEIDSLKTIITTTSDDSIKMLTYNKLRRLTYYSDASASKNFAEKYLEFAQKLKDSHNIVLAHYFLGNAELLKGNYKTATNKYLIGANYYEKKKDSAKLTSVLNALGAVYEKTENDSLSLVYYKKSKTIAELLYDNRRSGISGINIGNIYTKQNQIEKAITYYEDAVSNLEKNPKNLSFLILAKINLANGHRKKGESQKSIGIFLKTLSKIDTISDSYNHANILKGLSTCYLDINEDKKALNTGLKAYRIYEKFNFKDEQFQMMPDLIALYRRNNFSEKALQLYDSYVVVKDSLLKQSNNQQIADAVQKYETEKKDAQLKVLELEKEKADQNKKLYLYMTIFFILLAGLIGVFFYKNKKKNLLLTKKKRLLETTLDEKNVLLKEIHHRVKNSFQVVSSLLYMQSETIEDDTAKIALKEAENRIKSMVIMHQKLYKADDIVGINTNDYFKDLVKDIARSHNYKKQPVEYSFDVDNLVLDIETITPLGLILNELVVNVLKHAFVNLDKLSKLEISFKKENDNLVLRVKDNGKGFQPKTDESSFGILLMNALCKKLKATLTYNMELSDGAEAIVNIKKYNIIS